MNGRLFSQNPRKPGKSHHHHHLTVSFRVVYGPNWALSDGKVEESQLRHIGATKPNYSPVLVKASWNFDRTTYHHCRRITDVRQPHTDPRLFFVVVFFIPRTTESAIPRVRGEKVAVQHWI